MALWGSEKGRQGMMYFPILNFGAIWKSRILKITNRRKGLDLNELVTSFDNFLAPGASVKVQIHVSISTVFFMKTWAAWWTAFAGMVILGQGYWHFKIEEPLRGGNRFNHFPQKSHSSPTIGIPFNETASINTVLGFVFCWSLRLWDQVQYGGYTKPSCGCMKMRSRRNPVRQWHQTASRKSMCFNARVKVMHPFRIKRTNSSSLNPSKLASRRFAAQWRGRICNMPSPIAVLKEKLFEFQRIGQKLASRYWRKEAESKAFNLGGWWWLQIFFRKGRWNLKGRIYMYTNIYIYIYVGCVYGCFLGEMIGRILGPWNRFFMVFPLANHRDSESPHLNRIVYPQAWRPLCHVAHGRLASLCWGERGWEMMERDERCGSFRHCLQPSAPVTSPLALVLPIMTQEPEPEPPTPSSSSSSSSMIARRCNIGFLFLMFLRHRLHWLSLCCTTTATPDVWNDGSSTLKDVDCTKHMSLVKPNSRHLILQIVHSQQPQL